jgi:hypothetical protein
MEFDNTQGSQILDFLAMDAILDDARGLDRFLRRLLQLYRISRVKIQ